MSNGEKIWTVRQIAEHPDGKTEGYIRRLLIQGRMEGYKIGRDWHIDDSEAQRWFAIWRGELNEGENDD